MTFQFPTTPWTGVPAAFGANLVRARVRLVARWRRNADGRLECRWVRETAGHPG
jgi:hypothetical protein